MKKGNRKHTCCMIGVIGSLTGLLLTVMSMEEAPITTGKLLAAALCLIWMTACAYQLRCRPQKRAVSSDRINTSANNAPKRVA